jgi:hypothetical protein
MQEKFSNLIGLGEVVGLLQKPHFENVFYGKSEAPKESKKFRAVVGNDKEPFAFVTDRYKIVQSQDVLAEVVEALNKLELHEVEGVVIEEGGKTYAKIMLPYYVSETKREVGKDIRLGFMLQNSYDAKTSIRLSAIALRLVCANGMTVTRTIGEAYVKKHFTTFRMGIKKEVGEIVKAIVERSSYLRQVIDEALNDIMHDNKEFDELLEAYGFNTKKVKKEIAERITSENISRWDVYNAITNYYTFKKVRESTRTKKLEMAEALLVRATATGD